MQTWEYCFITCKELGGSWKPRYINGKEVKNWQNSEDIYAYSNRLGEIGWELVSVIAESSESGFLTLRLRLTFKRPKA
jgi:hypothetical protein